MKKFIAAITAFLTLSLTANAMSYSQAREQALFLTDKMAYELNLTEEQYDAAYEVNLDYLMSVNTYDDLYGAYWTMRNTDLSYILLDWQYRSFCAASYFYRPLYWTDGIWHFAIYSRYPHRNYFYFGRPDIYLSYRGGHGWSHNGGRSWYRGRTFNHGGIDQGHGMRDRFDRGDYRRGGDNNGPRGNNNGNYNRNDRGNNGNMGNGNNRGNRGNGGYNNGNDNRPSTNGSNQSATTNRQTGNFNGQRSIGQRNNRESSTRTTARPSTGTSRQSATSSRPTGRSFGNNSASGASRQSTTTNRATSRSFSGAQSRTMQRQSVSRQSTPSRSFTPSQSRGSSVSRSSSAPSRSFSGGGSSSHSSGRSGGGSSNGGGHFGGRR